MPMESLIVLLIVGAIAGWAAGQIVKGYGFGLVGNIVVGVVGAFIGNWLFPQLGLWGADMIGIIISAILGAVILLVVIGLVRRAG
ncbi:MAG: GlsB/YeaQ/YmgE family stress response membrane protein [Hyphomicrobium sp.]|nr:GlsB/YeaQ/YmgE family stress response membrane protein [Hyphomicrobium sp.]